MIQLPEDILLDILSRLSARDILAFRAVCVQCFDSALYLMRGVNSGFRGIDMLTSASTHPAAWALGWSIQLPLRGHRTTSLLRRRT